MAEVEVFQRDITDVVVVGNFHSIRISLAVISRFCAVSCFYNHFFGEDVLLVKKHFEHSLYFVKGELPFIER